MKPPKTLVFAAAGVTARVVCPPSLAPVLEGIYQPGDGRCAGPPDLRIEHRADGWWVHGPAAAEHVTSDETLRARVEAAVTDVLLRRLDEDVQVHAAGLATRDGNAVLVLGRSDTGKSSLAVLWSLAGRPVLGDDVLLVRDTRVRPFRRLFKVHPAVLRDAGADPAATPFWTPGSEEAWFDPAAHGGWSAPVPVRLVVCARRAPGAPSAVSDITPAEGLRALLGSLFPTGAQAAAAFDALADLVDDAPACTLSMPDARAGLRLIEERLR